jgi:hypothetical protein
MLLLAESPAQTVFTAVQAEAGRDAYLSTCVKCHTTTLGGRKGGPNELPPLDAIPPDYKKTVDNYGGQVPPLTGPEFLAKWKTTQGLANRIQEAVGGFPPDSAAETYLNITAYVLQVNGAKAGNSPLTAETVAALDSLGMAPNK